jgi:hypothetical protein
VLRYGRTEYRTSWFKERSKWGLDDEQRGLLAKEAEHNRTECEAEHTDCTISVGKCTMIWILIYLLTAIGLTPGGSSTVHIYTQTVHRTTQ